MSAPPGLPVPLFPPVPALSGLSLPATWAAVPRRVSGRAKGVGAYLGPTSRPRVASARPRAVFRCRPPGFPRPLMLRNVCGNPRGKTRRGLGAAWSAGAALRGVSLGPVAVAAGGPARGPSPGSSPPAPNAPAGRWPLRRPLPVAPPVRAPRTRPVARRPPPIGAGFACRLRWPNAARRGPLPPLRLSVSAAVCGLPGGAAARPAFVVARPLGLASRVCLAALTSGVRASRLAKGTPRVAFPTEAEGSVLHTR